MMRSKENKAILALFIAMSLMNSCVFPLAPRYHYFDTADSIEENKPTVVIFSTPQHKQYVVTGIIMNAEVFIQSPAFEHPNEFYLMKNRDFFEEKAKQYEIIRNDHKFYRTADFHDITLKIVNGAVEQTIKYKIVEKQGLANSRVTQTGG
jgi:hypothetical protein